MKENDNKILKLKQEIAKKKLILSGSKKFTPITNCNLLLGDNRINLHTLTTKGGIIEVMVMLNSMKLSAKDLGLLDQYMVSGYLLTEWLEDLDAKLNIVNRKDEETKLKALEDKLTRLLSLDKQTELEIDEIEKMLK
jgi:hypothetical protein